jgi:hypothetical protein
MNEIRARLTKDHEEIQALLRRLAEDADAPDAAQLQVSWAALEGRVLRHMEAEERYLLPLLEASHPAAVAKTHAEHGHIRDILSALGIAVELHSARKPDILQLIELLKAHSAYEDGALYTLAGERASVAIQHSVTAALKGLLSGSGPRAGRATGQGHAGS